MQQFHSYYHFGSLGLSFACTFSTPYTVSLRKNPLMINFQQKYSTIQNILIQGHLSL